MIHVEVTLVNGQVYTEFICDAYELECLYSDPDIKKIVILN